MLKKILKERVDNMQEKLLKINSKLEHVTTRRVLDIDGFLSEMRMVQQKLKHVEEKVSKSVIKVEREDILNDVKKLKNDIKMFQNEIKREHREEE